jgi:hypothetical protein
MNMMERKTIIIGIITVGLILITIAASLALTLFKEKVVYSEELMRAVNAELSQAKADRPNYLPAAMFKELPAFPPDLYQKKILIKYNMIDLNSVDLGSEYWLQPEWLENFESTWLPTIQNPPVNRWGAFGYAVSPGDTLVQVIRGEDSETEINTLTYIRSGLLVQTYQGLKVSYDFPNEGRIEGLFSGFSDKTRLAVQDGSEVQKYFSVSFNIISGKDGLVNGNNLILEPSYPIFRRGWVAKLQVKVKVRPDTPVGKYIIGFNLEHPESEYNQKMYLKYGTSYSPGGNVGINRPWYQLFIEVI